MKSNELSRISIKVFLDCLQSTYCLFARLKSADCDTGGGCVGGWDRNRPEQFKPLKMGLLVFVTPFALHRFFEKPTRFQCLINSRA